VCSEFIYKFVSNIFHSKKKKVQRDITINVEGASYTKVKNALFFSDFSKTNFLDSFSKNSQISSCMREDRNREYETNIRFSETFRKAQEKYI